MSRLDVKIFVLAGLILLSFFFLGLRLWFVQVKLANYYRGRIRGSSELTVRIPSVRGEIWDRNGIPLVTNRPSYEVDFYLPDIVDAYRQKYGQPPIVNFYAKDIHGMLYKRSEPDIVEIVEREIAPKLKGFNFLEPYEFERLRIHFRNNSLVPFPYRQDLDFTTFSKFAETHLALSGVQVNVKPLRQYNYGSLAAQILGYVGAPKDISQLPDLKEFDFYQPDVEGKINLEYSLDSVLRGKPGKRTLARNAKNIIDGEKETIQPTPGSNVYLTIDARIQYITENALRSVGRAAAVVVDPNNGQILAMASVPSFDPNKFIPGISANDWAAIQNAAADPLTNRATSVYAPGSSFKVVTTLSGLTRSLAKARFTCNGGVSYGNTYMRCWGVHGTQGLIDAIAHSCNAYFYQFGNAAGIDAIDRVGEALGLGQRSGIGLNDEDPGVLPSADWLKSTKNERWTPGQTANTAIGQGYVLVSPLQMAMVTATIANGGTSYQPTLIYQIQQPNGTIVRRPARIRADLTRDNGLSTDQIEIVRKGMFNVVNAPDGTGQRGSVEGVKVAGKTGTAQFWRNGAKDNRSWFVAFAPYDHPKIALAVMVEGGKSGGGVAAPIASEIIKKILLLDSGYDPGLKRLDPAVGNYKIVESVNFAKDATAQVVSTGAQHPDSTKPAKTEQRRNAEQGRKGKIQPRSQPDALSKANSRRSVQNPLRGFLSLFKAKPTRTQAARPEEQKHTHRFLFF